MISDQKMNEVVKKPVLTAKPLKIYLFDSYARSEAREYLGYK